MKYPNLRYGNPVEFEHYSLGVPLKELSKQLRRSEETIIAWRNGKAKIPFWVPELLRLRRMEHYQRMREMGLWEQRKKLGIVDHRGGVLPFKPPARIDVLIQGTNNNEKMDDYVLRDRA
ncbi:MAG: hypothetical protein V4448_18000 [Pseudomonadota bacterium]